MMPMLYILKNNKKKQKNKKNKLNLEQNKCKKEVKSVMHENLKR